MNIKPDISISFKLFFLRSTEDPLLLILALEDNMLTKIPFFLPRHQTKVIQRSKVTQHSRFMFLMTMTIRHHLRRLLTM